MITEGNLKTSKIITNYWNGGFNKGFNMTIIKEKKIDILTNYTITISNNAKEAEIFQKNTG
jgi:hypothetical protein